MHDQLKPYVKEITPEVAATLAPFLRDADKQEIRISRLGDLDYSAILLDNAEYCDRLYGGFLPDEEIPFTVFGVTAFPDDPTLGTVWLMGSEVIEQVSNTFLRESRTWVKKLGEGFRGLWCATDARNTDHHRWLRWLGFTSGGVVNAGVDGEPFIVYMNTQL